MNYKIKITGITLLSVGQYNKGNIPYHEKPWWLLKNNRTESAFAGISGDVYGIDESWELTSNFCVRPLLILSNPKKADLNTGDKFHLFGLDWTVRGRYALCDESIGECPFRKDHKASDAMDFEKSDVKAYLDNWLSEQLQKEEANE